MAIPNCATYKIEDGVEDKTKCTKCQARKKVSGGLASLTLIGGVKGSHGTKCLVRHVCKNGEPHFDSGQDVMAAAPRTESASLGTEKCTSCNFGWGNNRVPDGKGKCNAEAGTAAAKAETVQMQYIVTAEQQRQDIILYVALFLVMLLIGFFIMKKMGITRKKTGIFSLIGSDIKVNDLPVAFWVFIWTVLASFPIWWFGIDHCIQWGEDGKKIINYRSDDEMAPEICNRLRSAGVSVPDSFFGDRKMIPNESCDRPDGQCWNFHWRHFMGFVVTIIVCYIIFTALIVGAMPSGKFPDGIPLVLIISIFAFSVETGWKRAKWRGIQTKSGEADKKDWKSEKTKEHQKPMVAQWQPIMLMGIIGFIIFGLFVFGGIGNKSLNDIDNEEKVMFGIVAVSWFIHWGYDLTQTYGIPHHAT